MIHIFRYNSDLIQFKIGKRDFKSDIDWIRDNNGPTYWYFLTIHDLDMGNQRNTFEDMNLQIKKIII